MKRLIVFIVCVFTFAQAQSQHKVYLLHGYANPKSIMRKIDKDLKKSGFNSENYAYPGLYEELDSLGKRLYEDVLSEDLDSVSFVTHSMGGLVVRSMLRYSGEDPTFPTIYRIVMIAPPNKGAAIADFFKSYDKLSKLLGPNVAKMQTDTNSFANQLPIPCNTQIGIIIGKRGKNKGYNILIEGDNDGLVKPEHTLLGNETDTISLKLDHLALIKRKKSRKRVLEFLNNGQFSR
ncbi:MAG: hypothetical protein JXR36_11815 [Bacteroidales bacterium]|nr:hypothetical protein [Bacteroidales bacterium]